MRGAAMALMLLLIFVCFAKALAVGIECHCPEHFKEYERNTMWCVVNMTAVKEAKCTSEQKGIYMDLASKSSPDKIPIPCEDNNSIYSSDYCKCNNISADLLNCTVSMQGNKTRDEGKELICKACMRPRGNLTQTRTDGCKHITFVSSNSGTTCSSGMLLSAFCLLLMFIATH